MDSGDQKKASLVRTGSRVKDLQKIFDSGRSRDIGTGSLRFVNNRNPLPALVQDHSVSPSDLFRKPSFSATTDYPPENNRPPTRFRPRGRTDRSIQFGRSVLSGRDQGNISVHQRVERRSSFASFDYTLRSGSVSNQSIKLSKLPVCQATVSKADQTTRQQEDQTTSFQVYQTTSQQEDQTTSHKADQTTSFQVYQTTSQQEDQTTSHKADQTTSQQENQATSQQEDKATRQQEDQTTSQQEDKTTSQQGDQTISQQGDQTTSQQGDQTPNLYPEQPNQLENWKQGNQSYSSKVYKISRNKVDSTTIKHSSKENTQNIYQNYFTSRDTDTNKNRDERREREEKEGKHKEQDGSDKIKDLNKIGNVLEASKQEDSVNHSENLEQEQQNEKNLEEEFEKLEKIEPEAKTMSRTPVVRMTKLSSLETNQRLEINVDRVFFKTEIRSRNKDKEKEKREECSEEGLNEQNEEVYLDKDAVYDLDKGSAYDLDKGSVYDLDKRSAYDMDKGSAYDLDKGSVYDMDNGAAYDLDKGSAYDLDKGLAHDLDKGSAHDLDKGSAYDLDKGSAYDLDKGSDYDLDSDYEPSLQVRTDDNLSFSGSSCFERDYVDISDIEGSAEVSSTLSSDNDKYEEFGRRRSSDAGPILSNQLSSYKSSKPSKTDGFVGFSRFPQQIYNKAIRFGFELNLLVLGEQGLGKQTFINSLFKRDLSCRANQQNTEILGCLRRRELVLKENNVLLKLRIVDMPNFASQIDNSNCWEPIIQYIDAQFSKYMREEERIERRRVDDTRSHACLYFIPPTGAGLRLLDMSVLKALDSKVNLIPIISKADSFTCVELSRFRSRISADLQANNISSFYTNKYGIPEPFAVIGGERYQTLNQDENYKSRRYPWGLINIENKEFCDFQSLRELLLKDRTVDLIEKTNELYEKFRSNWLVSVNYAQVFKEEKHWSQRLKFLEVNLQSILQKKVEEREARLTNYLESEERKLEAELAKIRKEKDDIDEKRRDFETWKSNFVQTVQRSKSLQHMKKKGSHEFLDQWTEEDRPSKGSLVERWSRSQGKGPSSNLRGLLTLTRSKKK
ncbi:uncharacterized protein LOC111710050 isoform X2 [Eurytemora carolleeae]|uniref:uncharacterized protein LOC111710050 isoform X2 n=1 Tax=Eurytemora carolleeae TaxID=1294199 RepID=UPI000C78D3CA|nr:uncharacterized protein LOC111710050 isoform X2 [Eurytemora carolleeae]|eukprot:XP_023339846.1 uncharacterized protein LOC111710050 isoform X2 [Eurytemora affinis]